jgi:Fe-S-cluster containining protein
MLVDDRCSIYDHRPQTCRAYDCRVFAATAIENEEKPVIARQARRWRFSYATEADRAEHDRLQAAAAQQPSASPTERAVRAIDGRADVADET